MEELLLAPPERRAPTSTGARAVRRLGAVAAAGLLLVTAVTLGRGDPQGRDTNGGPLEVAGGLPPPAEAVGSPGDGGAPADGTRGGAPGSVDLGFVPAAPGGTPTPGGTSAEPGPAAGGDASRRGDRAPAEGPTSVAVVSPTLRLFAFGGRLGLPLVCAVANGALAPGLTDPALAAIAGQIVATCASSAGQGADALLQLDRDLAALAAVNPAVVPLLEQLATAFEQAAEVDAPFVGSLLELAALLRFFAGT